MNKPLLIFFVFFYIATTCVNAQTKKVVAIMPFLTTVPENKQIAAELQSITLQVFSQNNNITIVDRSADAMVLKELNNQIREESISSKTLVEQGKLSGSQEIIVGTLNNVSVEPRGNKYLASLNYTLQVDDAATGVVISTQSFKGNTNGQDLGSKILGARILGNKANQLGEVSSVMMADTKDAAINNAINATKRQISEWISENYPPEIKMLAVDTRDNSGRPVTLSMAGIDGKAAMGKIVTVNEISYLDAGTGHKLRKVKKIAELKVIEAQGEVTECKVKNGGDAFDQLIKTNSKMEFSLK